MKRIARFALYALIIALAVACAADPVRTVNQQLYPYLVVNTSGEIRVAKGAALTDLIIPDDVYIDGKNTATVFVGFQDEADKVNLKSVTIGSGITDIGANAFKEAESLESVTFEKGSELEMIGSSAFQNTGLVSVVLPDTPVIIGENAFTGNEALESVDLGGTKEVGKGAFSGNASLTNVDFGSVSTIGDEAFMNTGLYDVKLPETPVIIGENAFNGNENLQSVDLGGTTEVGNGAFGGNASLSSVDFGSVSVIGDDAFKNTGLTEVVLPEDSPVTIGKGAFSENNALQSVDLGGTTEIGDGAFENSSSLSKVDFGDTDEIGKNAFKGTDLGPSIVIPSTVGSISAGAFQDTGIIDVTLNGGSTGVSNTAFDKNIVSLDIPANMTDEISKFGDNIKTLWVWGGGSKGNTVDAAVNSLKNLQSVYIYNTETIESGAFNGLSSLTNVTLGSGLETIGKNAFTGTGAATAENPVVLPATVTDAKDAFDADDHVSQKFEIIIGGIHADEFTLKVWPAGQADKTNIADLIAEAVKSVTAGNNNKYVDGVTAPAKNDGKSTYHQDEYMDLADVTINAVLPGTYEASEGKEQQQYTTSGIINVDVLDRSIDFTKTGSVGLVEGNTSTSVEIPLEYRGDKITTIADNGFQGNVSVIIPEGNGIENIGTGAFQGNTAFDSENFDNLFKGNEDNENKTVVIGDDAFNGATGITEEKEDGKQHLVIPGNAASIGSGAFQNTGAEVITIPQPSAGNTDRTFAEGAFGPSDTLQEVIVEGPASGLTGKDIADAFGAPNNNVTKLTVPADAVDTPDEIAALKEAFPYLEELVVTPGTGSNGTISGLEGWDSLDKVDLSESGITEIGNNAFKGTGVQEVIFPDTLQTIGESAFEGCDELISIGTADNDGNVEVRLPESLDSIGNNAFNGAVSLGKENGDKTVSGGELNADRTDVTGGIFEGFDGTIGNGAFAGTAIGPELNLGDVASVGKGAFAGTDKNNDGFSVKLPTDCTTDIDSFFRGDDGKPESIFVDDLIIVEGNKDPATIGQLAGKENTTEGYADLVLDNVIVNNGVSNVGESAFEGVGATSDNPLSVTLPDTITEIGANAFKDAPLSVDNTGLIQQDTDGKLIIKDSNGDSKLPSGVTNIGAGAFQNSGVVADENGNAINLGEFIPDDAKLGDDALAGINIGSSFVITDDMNSLDEISRVYGEDQTYTEVKELTVPIDLINTDEKAAALKDKFPNLTSITVTGSENWPAGESQDKTICGISKWGDTLTSVDISNSNAETIGAGAFSGLDNVTSDNLKLPNTITTVKENAFKGTAAFDEDHLASLGNLETIGNGAFANTGVVDENNTLTIPDSVTSVGTGAFAGVGGDSAESAINVKLPSDVSQNIDDFFTSGEDHNNPVFIDKLTITGDNPVGPLAGPKDNFAGNTNLSVGEKAELVINNIEVSGSVTEIADNAFNGIGTTGEGTLTVKLPDSVTSIGDNAFANASLKVDADGIILEDSETDDPDSNKLVVTTDESGNSKLPSGVTSIGDGAFQNSGLVADNSGKPVDVSDFLNNNGDGSSITKIGEDAFSGVNIGDNTDIVIPDSVISIGDGAFAVVDEEGTPAAGKQPGINITIPGNAIGKHEGGSADDQGLADIVLPSGEEKRPAFFENVTVTGGTGDDGYTTGILTGSASSAGVDIVIGGSLDFGGNLEEFDGDDFASVGIPSGDSTLDVTISGELTDLTGDLSSGPKVVNDDGSVSEETGSVSFGDGEEAVPPASSIDDGVFEGRDDIEVLVIPADMTHIGSDAFKNCTNLSEIIFEGPRETPITIEDGAFSGCSSLDKITYRENDVDKTPGNIEKGTAWFPENTIEGLSDNVFADTGFKNVILSDDITSVSDSAFDSDKDINVSVTVPVNGFMNAEKGDKDYPKSTDVTFSGTWPNMTDISATIDGETVTVPKKYGYKGTWTVDGESIAIGEDSVSINGITVSDIVANKGGIIEWKAKEYALTAGESTINVTFGDEISWDNLIGDIKRTEGHEITEITIGSTTIKKGDSFTLEEELDGNLSFTFKEEIMKATVSITNPDGESTTVDIQFGDSWEEELSTDKDVKYAFGDAETVNSSELLFGTVTEEQIVKIEDGATLSRYYPVTKDGQPVYYKEGSSLTGAYPSDRYFISTESGKSGSITLSDSVPKVDNAPLYVYEYFTITFDATQYGTVNGQQSIKRYYIKDSSIEPPTASSGNNNLEFKQWSPTIAVVSKDATYTAVYKLSSSLPAGWPSTAGEVLIGKNPATGKDYTIGDFLPAGTGNLKYAYNVTKKSPVTIDDINASRNVSTEVLLSGTGSIQSYYDLTGKTNGALPDGYYKAGDSVATNTGAGFDWSINGQTVTPGNTVTITDPANISVTKNYWNFSITYGDHIYDMNGSPTILTASSYKGSGYVYPNTITYGGTLPDLDKFDSIVSEGMRATGWHVTYYGSTGKKTAFNVTSLPVDIAKDSSVTICPVFEPKLVSLGWIAQTGSDAALNTTFTTTRTNNATSAEWGYPYIAEGGQLFVYEIGESEVTIQIRNSSDESKNFTIVVPKVDTQQNGYWGWKASATDPNAPGFTIKNTGSVPYQTFRNAALTIRQELGPDTGAKKYSYSTLLYAWDSANSRP